MRWARFARYFVSKMHHPRCSSSAERLLLPRFEKDGRVPLGDGVVNGALGPTAAGGGPLLADYCDM
jgi:hypothetical protein